MLMQGLTEQFQISELSQKTAFLKIFDVEDLEQGNIGFASLEFLFA